MSFDRKRHFVEELKRHYQETIAGAHRAEVEAGAETEAIHRDASQKEDAKGAVQSARLASAHRERRQRARHEVQTLIRFAANGLRAFRSDERIDLGALVDVRIETADDAEERTLFLLPVGAGTELTGPGGDGFVSVITPESKVGQALRGSQVGDDIEVRVAGQEREWIVVDLC